MAGLFGARIKQSPYFAPTAYPVTPGSTSTASAAPFTPTAYPVAPGATGQMPAPQAAAPTFGKPSTLQTIAGIVGDSLAQWQGGQPLFAQTQAMRQKAAYDAAQANRERAAKFADETAMYDYKLAHPQSDAPGETEKLLAASGLVPGTPEYQTAAKQALERRNDPFITTSLPGGGFYGGPQSQLLPILRGGAASGGAQGAAPPKGAIDYLRQNPSTSAQFDAKYGAGASAGILQGGGQTTSPMTPATAAPILRDAQARATITPVEAAQIRASLGPNGQAAFDQWLKQNNVTIGGQ